MGVETANVSMPMFNLRENSLRNGFHNPFVREPIESVYHNNVTNLNHNNNNNMVNYNQNHNYHQQIPMSIQHHSHDMNIGNKVTTLNNSTKTPTAIVNNNPKMQLPTSRVNTTLGNLKSNIMGSAINTIHQPQ